MSEKSSHQSAQPTLHLLTLNCWGLKYLAAHRHARLSEIGRQISIMTPAPEIVALQECWTQQDFLSITESCSTILPYSKFYFSGPFGGGLAVLSKWPILESSMWKYPLNGRPSAFWRGDWYVGKGVACAKIAIQKRELGMETETEDVQIVEVFNTHLHAPYEREPNDSYICHRTAQAWEIAKLMRGAAERGSLVLGMGDFNMIPMSFAHRVITTHAPVEDAWRILHPNSAVGAANDEVEKARKRPIPTLDQSLKYEGSTCDSVGNTWRWGEERQKLLNQGKDVTVDLHTEDPKAKRLDYIFVGDGSECFRKKHGILGTSSRGGETNTATWQVTSTSVEMTMRHPTLKCSLSDHFAVAATLTYSTASSPPITTTTDSSSFEPLYPSIVSLVTSYTTYSYAWRKYRILHFWVSFAVSIACLITIPFTARITNRAAAGGTAFALCLLSTLNLASGVIDGLIGLLFNGGEERALKEFMWEVRNAEARAGKSQDEMKV